METKHSTSIRLTEEERRLIEKLAKLLGVTKASVLALAIREYAAGKSVK